MRIRNPQQSKKKRGHRRPKRYYRVDWQLHTELPPGSIEYLLGEMTWEHLSEFDSVTEVLIVPTK